MSEGPKHPGFDPVPANPETDAAWNQDPQVLINPGSPHSKEMQKHEQFPSKYGANPGNPYKYRPFPKAMYRAQLVGGVARCMAAPPEPHQFDNEEAYRRAKMQAVAFDRECYQTAQDEQEMQRLMESNWRPTQAEAIAVLEGKEKNRSTATAEREYADQHMSDAAKREIRKAKDEVGGEHLPEIPRKRVARRKKVSRKKG